MKILHTSDWHIGRTLYGRKRYHEFSAFFKWLTNQIADQQIEALIVAGDIFDTGTPSNRAQQLYYHFLHSLASTGCRHIVIVGGNHDSPSLLDAPKELLKTFQVHVVGSAPEKIEDEVLLLKDSSGDTELIVCAVPYLRDRDVRSAAAGEDHQAKNNNLIEGIAGHYQAVCEHAISIQADCSHAPPPIVATGHLFAAGGTKVEGDGVRDLYVGSLVHVDGTIFPEAIAYLALGHLHSSQRVGGNTRFRYSGAPLAMGFHEAEKDKVVLVIDLAASEPHITEIAVPRWQKLKSITGNAQSIPEQLDQLTTLGESVWVEILYDGDEVIASLQQIVAEGIADSAIEVLRIVNNRLKERVLERQSPQETLEEMSEEDVFCRCLQAQEIPEKQSELLLDLFRQTVQELNDEDSQAQ
ncbi:exonuclease SbcCD subunit D C-terminal domain-containing protein [Desulfosediminicola ganghwensis]|uniref:exonuclease SbcCD subunit D C-terminal domain-containing protein n=1 Tax=Desulfosediminicola ganghwensis TaxID=2569540 RepID=UPI0010ABAD2E|nr:exonuclease SbcCD subunit D C-terminal domain-containing protein [Desulfosediminicola ganghwensis]